MLFAENVKIYTEKYWLGNMWVGVIGVVIAMVIAFVLTIVFWKDENVKPVKVSAAEDGTAGKKELLDKEIVLT